MDNLGIKGVNYLSLIKIHSLIFRILIKFVEIIKMYL